MRLAAAALLLAALGLAPHALRFGRFGAVEIVEPPTPGGDVAILLADAGRAELAAALAARGALVLAIDPSAYLEALRGSSEPCAYPAGELEGLSHFAEQRLGRADYAAPILVGSERGAAVARAAFAQAPPSTFRGALVLGRAELTRALCRGRGVPGDPALITLPAERTSREVADAFAALAARSAAPSPALAASVADLPLVELPVVGGPPKALAVILSGDGGWASLDREVGSDLAARGIPVVGWNSLRYFWTARTPDEGANALARVLRHYLAAWRAPRALLVGYSFGADALPFLVSRLPPDLRARVAVVALLGPSRTAAFEFHFADWLGGGDRPGTRPVAPELAKLAGLRVLCVYGREERDSLCPTLAPELAERVERPGDHHFGGDYAAIAARLAAE